MDVRCEQILDYMEEHKTNARDQDYRNAIQALAELKRISSYQKYVVVIASTVVKEGMPSVFGINATEYVFSYTESQYEHVHQFAADRGGASTLEAIQLTSTMRTLLTLLKTHDRLTRALCQSSGWPPMVSESQVVAVYLAPEVQFNVQFLARQRL